MENETVKALRDKMHKAGADLRSYVDRVVENPRLLDHETHTRLATAFQDAVKEYLGITSLTKG